MSDFLAGGHKMGSGATLKSFTGEILAIYQRIHYADAGKSTSMDYKVGVKSGIYRHKGAYKVGDVKYRQGLEVNDPQKMNETVRFNFDNGMLK